MNNKINLNSATLRLLHVKYKEFIIPSITIIVSIILFFVIILPQINSFFGVKEKAKADLEKLNTVRSNLNLLSGINQASLDSYFKVVTTALPLHKEFEGVLNALSIASQKSGVSLGNFEFKVGDLSKVENAARFPDLKLNISVNGSLKGVANFIEELSRTLPLSEVTDISISNTLSNITISFYYKAMQSFVYNDTIPITPISKSGLLLINKLSGFNSFASSSGGLLEQ